MLESLASALINRFLGAYVEDFDPTQLNVGIWNGDVKLKNLRLRKDSLDALDLPVDVKFGHLGELTLLIPWSSLKNKPVKIIIEDVYMICTPRSSDSYNVEEQVLRELNLKLQRLAELEIANSSKPDMDPESGKNESFTQSLLTKIVDNLQVTVKNIHLRYEDMNCLFSEKPMAVGISLSELSAVSTDEEWKPSFISIRKQLSHKLATLESICAYWNTDATSIDDEDTDELIIRLRESIPDSHGVPDHQYILKPVRGSARLKMNKLGSTENQPHIDAQLMFDEFAVVLDDCQYKEILHNMSKYHWFHKTMKYRGSRPTTKPMDDPVSWFKFTATCVLDEIHEKNYKRSWEYIKDRRHKRDRYVRLWKKKLTLPNVENKLPNLKDEEELYELHKELPLDDIKFFRAFARREFSKESRVTKFAENLSTNSAQQGWFSSWWSPANADGKNMLAMTEEQRKELYDAIEYDDTTELSNSINLPKDRVKVRIANLLQKGSLTIMNKTKGHRMCDFIFEKSATEFLKRPDSFMFNFELSSFLIEDGSPHTLYKHIISPRNQEECEQHDPLLHLTFDSSPLDDLADSYLDLKFGSVFIYYHVHFINELIKFFNPPKQHWDTIFAIMNAAEATMEGWTTQTRMGLEALLDEHKTINLNLNAASPTIIIPLDAHSWDSPCAIIDAGSIKMKSDLVPKQEIKKIKELSVEEYAKINSEELKRLMFDRFEVNLSNTQFLIGPDMKSSITSINIKKDDNNFTILERMELNFILDILIFPKALNLPKVKALVKLPNLNIFLNDYQYKIMMQLIEKCIPFSDTENTDTDEDPSFSYYEDEQEQQRLSKLEKENQLLLGTKRTAEKMTQSELAQISFQLDLDVSKTQISLLKCSNGSSMTSSMLVKLIGEGLSLKISKRFSTMDFDIALNELRLEDHIETSSKGENEYIISTNDGINGRLFDIKGSRSQRIIEYQGSVYELFDLDLALRMSELTLFLSPKSILTLLNFIINTFTDPDAPPIPSNALRQSQESGTNPPGKTVLNILLDGINIVLKEDSSDLATFSIHGSEVMIDMLPESMKIKARLGDMKLTDETSTDLPRDSLFRQLITHEEDDLAELLYESYDPEINPNSFDSYLYYRTGAMRINFIEHSVNKILLFFAKFQKMKGLFDTARNSTYNQTPDIETVNNMRLDIKIKAPSICFPKLIDPRRNIYDFLTWNMGDFYISNNFSLKNKHLINNITTGIKNAQLLSKFNFEGSKVQDLYAIDNLDLKFDIIYDPNSSDENSSIKIKGYFAPFYVNLTDLQLQYSYLLVQRVFQSFNISNDNENFEDVELAALTANSIIDPQKELHLDQSVFLETENNKTPSSKGIEIEFEFEAPEFCLSLFSDTAGKTSLDNLGIARIKMEDIGLSGSSSNTDTIQSEMHIKSFTVEDTRFSKTNKHSQLIPKIEGEHYQFMASFSRRNESSQIITDLESTVDSPRVVLAVEFLFALKKFFDSAFNVKLPASIKEYSETSNKSNLEVIVNQDYKQESSKKTMEEIFNYSINVVDSAIILLADPSDIHSEAVVFTIGQLEVSDHNVLSISSNNVGLFLSRMGDLNENRIRILDDFSATIIIDGRDSTADVLKTHIHSSIGPLLLRLSLRDIRLAMEIFNTSLSMAKNTGLIADPEDEKDEDISTKYGRFSKEFKNRIRKFAPSIISSLSEVSKVIHKTSGSATKVVAKAEKLHLDVAGVRMVLIGDIHELPIADFNVDSFSVDAKDWSTKIDVMATLEMYASAFNYSRSNWEPLVESFPVTFHLCKDEDNNNALMLDILSRKTVEVTLSSRTIALLSKIPQSLQKAHNLKPRGAEKPYKIFNDTGLEMEIWLKNADDTTSRKNLTVLSPGEAVEWEFEDWRVVRETLDTTKSILYARFVNEKYTNIIEVDATKEGDVVHKLLPAISNVHNRLLISSQLLETNVKLITFSSTLLIKNSTSTNIQIGILSGKDCSSYGIIEPQCSRSIPLEDAYACAFRIRPVSDTLNYEWCGSDIKWKTLYQSPMSLSCPNSSQSSYFYFEAESMFDLDDPLSKIYPRMTVVISAPVVLENLLPYPISYSLYEDKNEDGRIVSVIPEGESTPLHSVSLDSFLLLSIIPNEEGFNWSKEALVNSPLKSEVREEYRTLLTTDSGQKIFVNLRYHSSGKRAKTISIYAPYVILNKTGHELYIYGDKQWGMLKSEMTMSDGAKVARPKIFSFQYEDYNKNRAKLKFVETNPSIPVSFDAIGQPVDISLELLNHNQECNLGIKVSEGEDRYRFTKIVEISPRYIIKNSSKDALEFMEYGSTSSTYLKPSETVPLYLLKKVLNKKLVLRFAKIDSTWSNPFRIKDVGETYVKMNVKDSAQRLVKMNITLEAATIFIEIVDSDDNWPFSIRNFSDQDFLFWQRNPRFVDDEADEFDYYYQDEDDEVDFEPIYYRIPPRSVMPYSWDYPSAKQKKLYIHSKNRRRELDLNEIGNLRPIRIPGDDAKDPPCIVDINILMDNGVQALVLSNYNQERSLYKLRSQRRIMSETSLASSNNSNSDQFEVDENIDSKLNARVVVSFSGIGISLINHRLQELCYINILGLECRFNDSEMYQNISFKLKWIQVDNQLFGGVYETILYPTKIPKDSKEIEIHPALSGALSKVKDESSSLLNFKMATILLQEMTIQIDEDFLVALLYFVKIPGASWNQESQSIKGKKMFDEPLTIPEFPVLVKTSQVYFEMLHLQPTLLHLSFVRTDRINVEEEKTSGDGAVSYFINVLTMALGNIEDAQIKLNSLLLEHVRVSSGTLIAAIQSHYAQQFFYQLHKVLGSADFLGNPVGFFNNISSGVMDIFYEPYQGYIMNDRPQELGIGIAKGGLSFLKKSIFGFSDSFAKMTGSVAKGLSVAIQDNSFHEKRRLQQRQRGKFGSLGVGASSFFSNITSGITGVALDPYTGGAKEGTFGFIKGVGKGLIGLPAKTAIGVLDLASNVSEGIKNSTTFMDGGQIERVRLPRFISSDKLIKPYNLRDSQGQYWLKTCNGGEYAKDFYVGHVICETPAGYQIVLVSLERILRLQLSTLTVMEHIPFNLIRNVRVIKTGITIYTSEREYFFSIPKDEERRYLYKLVHTAVMEFNAKWQISL